MDNAPQIRRSRSVAERNADRASKAFAATPDGRRHNEQEGKIQKQAGDIAGIKQRLEKVEDWQGTFEAKTPLSSSGNQVSLDARALANVRGLGGGGGTADTPLLKFFGVQSGGYAAWLIAAEPTTP